MFHLNCDSLMPRTGLQPARHSGHANMRNFTLTCHPFLLALSALPPIHLYPTSYKLKNQGNQVNQKTDTLNMSWFTWFVWFLKSKLTRRTR